MKFYWETIMLRGARLKKNLVLWNLDMFVWMSGFQNLLAHTHFDMFVDEWTSANKTPGLCKYVAVWN